MPTSLRQHRNRLSTLDMQPDSFLALARAFYVGGESLVGGGTDTHAQDGDKPMPNNAADTLPGAVLEVTAYKMQSHTPEPRGIMMQRLSNGRAHADRVR